MLQRKSSRRCSAQYYISAEEHVENEVKHERLLTETSRLSSSWAGLTVSGNEKAESECSSSSVSASNSPNHRPNSFSGPLVISVTCSSNSCPGAHGCHSAQPSSSRCTPTSPNPHSLSSGHVSPVASPVSSRVQCYSPGLTPSLNSPTTRRPSNANASPLLLPSALCRKRGYFSSMLATGGSSDDASREGSPDSSFSSVRGSKSMRQADGRVASFSDPPQFRWPPGPPLNSNPPSPSCHLFPSLMSTAPSSPSTSSLPSPRLSLNCSMITFPGSPASSVASNSLTSSGGAQPLPLSPKSEAKPTDGTDMETSASIPLLDESNRTETVSAPECEPVSAS